MRVFLTGYMGSGKSTIGRKLANALGWRFIDMDHHIEKQYGKSISGIFKDEGENKFRELEQRAVKESCIWQKTVVSTGGGTPCFNNNMELLTSNGLCFYLYMPPKALADRLLQSKKERPLIKDLSLSELENFIKNNLQEREEFYYKSHFTVDVLNAYIVQIMADKVKEHYNV